MFSRPTLVGSLHNEITRKIVKIFLIQKEDNIANGIKGFILYGPPGTGKSTIARAVVYDIARAIDLLHFTPDQLCALISLADIAKSRYGDTENLIREKFEKAMKIAKNNGGFYIIVMDDVDGIFPTRHYERLDAWYLGHLNVLFDEIDKLETDKVGVIMTTNRKDLLDEAVISRLVDIEIPFIDLETARLKIESRIKELKMDSKYSDIIYKNIKNKLKEKIIENLTFRDVEKEIIFSYLQWAENRGGN
ncbi:MAG: ATP-binding protein [Promethearchaeota archaeon]